MSLISAIHSLFGKTFKSKDYTVRIYSHLMNHACYCIIGDKEYPIYFNKSKTKSYVIRKAKSGTIYRQYFMPDMNKIIGAFRMKYPSTSFLITKN